METVKPTYEELESQVRDLTRPIDGTFVLSAEPTKEEISQVRQVIGQLQREVRDLAQDEADRKRVQLARNQELGKLRDDWNAAIKRAEKAEVEVRDLTGERETQYKQGYKDALEQTHWDGKLEAVSGGKECDRERCEQWAGELRSELKLAIPRLREGDIEWLVGLVSTETEKFRTKSESLERQLAGMRGA